MKFRKNLFSNLITQILSIIMGFLTSILIARALGVIRQGYFSYYLLIFGLIATYGNLSITNSNSYFIKKEKFERDKIISNNITILLILNILYAIIVFLLKDIIFNSVSNRYLLLLIWIIYSFSIMFFNYFSTIHIVDETIYLYNRYSNFANILKCLVIVLLYLFNCLNIVTISATYSLIELLKTILIKHGLNIKLKLFLSFDILKEEFKYGIPLYLSALFIYFNYRADLFMVKAMLGDFQLGIYSIAVHLAELAFLVPTSIVSAFEARLYSVSKENKTKITEKTIKMSFYVTSIICLIGILCKPLVTVLYGREYEPAGLCMIILLLGIAFASIGKIAPAYFYTQGKPKIHLLVSSIVLLINIIFNYLLIPRYGINGAAIASTISYMFYGIIYLFFLKKQNVSIKNIFNINKKDLLIMKKNVIKYIKK